jgi:hypothetical protein
VMAGAQGTMNNFTFGNAKYQYYETISGGSGAGLLGKDAQGELICFDEMLHAAWRAAADEGPGFLFRGSLPEGKCRKEMGLQEIE